MQEERLKVLEMLSKQKITVDEADRLLRALDQPEENREAKDENRPRIRPKTLRILVEPKEPGKSDKRINIRIPLALVRAGIKLGNVLPGEAREKINEALKEKGIEIDVNDLDSKSMEELLAELSATSIDVDSDKESVRIFCE